MKNKTFILSLCASISTFFSAHAQITNFSIYGGEQTTLNGGLVCVGGGFQNPGFVSDVALDNATTFNSLVDLLGCSATVNVPIVSDITTETIPATPTAQRFTGFMVGSTDLLTLLANATINTYNNNVLVESTSGSSLLSLLNGGQGYIYTYATAPFNQVELTVTGLAGALTSIDYYFGFSTLDTFSLLGGPLSITMESFGGHAVGNSSQLEWKVSENDNSSMFYIERSINGKTFGTIGTVKASEEQYTYTYTDMNATPNAMNYYRLKIMEASGKIEYSKVIAIKHGEADQAPLIIYPNPVRDQMTINIPYEGKQNIKITDLQGRDVWFTQIESGSGTFNISSDVLGHLAKGTYILEIRNNDRDKVQTQFILQ